MDKFLIDEKRVALMLYRIPTYGIRTRTRSFSSAGSARLEQTDCLLSCALKRPKARRSGCRPCRAARAVGVREVGGALWSAVRMSLDRPDASLTTVTTHTSQHNSHARSTMETLRRFRFHGSEQESPRPMSPAHPLSSFIPIHIPYGCCWAGAPSQIGGFRPTGAHTPPGTP